MKKNITILLIFAITATIFMCYRSVDVETEISTLRVEYDYGLEALRDDLKRVMNRYGTRLTLMEKAVKKYHGVETLDDLTKKKG